MVGQALVRSQTSRNQATATLGTLTGSGMRPMLSAMPLDDVAEFITHHRPCGQLTGDATEPEANGYMVTVGCSCGVTFMRWVTPEEAADELGGVGLGGLAER
jgi:hypothetical protein